MPKDIIRNKSAVRISKTMIKLHFLGRKGYKFDTSGVSKSLCPIELAYREFQLQFILDFRMKPVKELCETYQISEATVNLWARAWNAKRSSFFKNSGCFTRGSEPANKGKKQVYRSEEARQASEATRFKKGQVPQNRLPIGSLTYRSRFNRNRDSGWYMKVAEPNHWKEVKHLVWEKTNGPIPKGMVVRIINGDINDLRIENLQLITMKENGILNSASTRLTDRYVAFTIATKKNHALVDELLANHPELIELKKLQIILKRQINHGTERQA